MGSTGRANGGVRAQFTTPVNILFSQFTIEKLRELQELAGEYRLLAASAEKGSVQQIAAADLAAKAQKRLGLEVLATNASVRTSARETALAEREMSKFARGSLSATGGFGKAGIGLALGSGGFLAGAAVSQGMVTAVKAAEGYAVALRALDGAITHSGGNLAAYSEVITKLADGGAKLGYSNTEILSGLKQLTLITGNATDAVTYMGLVEDLARGKGISLETAATAVGKAIDGKTTALQRYGVVVQKGQSVESALTQAQQRWAGQAKDSTTATMELGATVKNLEQKIGAALLPSVEHIATATENWISKSQNQKTVVNDVKTAVSGLTDILKGAKTVIHDVDGVTGGFEHTLKLLIGLKVGAWALGVAGDFMKLAGGEAAAGGIGLASSRATGLLGILAKLKALGPIGLTIALGLGRGGESGSAKQTIKWLGLKAGRGRRLSGSADGRTRHGRQGWRDAWRVRW